MPLSKFLLSISILGLFFIAKFNVFGQNSTMEITRTIPYAVGFKDTILIHPTERFPYGQYEGGKPFLLQVWYPLAERPNSATIFFSDYLDLPGRDSIGGLLDSTISLWQQSIIRDGLMPDRRLSFEPNHQWPTDNLQQMLAILKQQPQNVYADGTVASGRFPVVIYHHGAQSMPFENNLLCEELASQGFVVVSSNYNLANEIMPDMLLRSMEDGDSDDDLLYILDYARSIPMVDTATMFGIGFSAGAQALLKFDLRPGPKPFRAIVSLHTTLEDKTIAYIKERGMWEQLLPIIDGEAEYALTPTWLLAPQNWYVPADDNEQQGKLFFKSPDFEPFRPNRTTPYRFITLSYPLSHDGFISMGNWRYGFHEQFNYPDRREIELEYRAHQQVNQQVSNILQWYVRGAHPDEAWLLHPFNTERP